MYRYLLIAATLGLAACATPAERCISNATKGMGELDAEIAEAQANVARGYRLEDRAINTVDVEYCTTSGSAKICLGGVKDIQPRQIPINVADERARLAALENQRAVADARAQREIAACQNLS